MVQRYLAIVAILGAIVAIGIGMVATGIEFSMTAHADSGGFGEFDKHGHWHCIWQYDQNGNSECV